MYPTFGLLRKSNGFQIGNIGRVGIKECYIVPGAIGENWCQQGDFVAVLRYIALDFLIGIVPFCRVGNDGGLVQHFIKHRIQNCIRPAIAFIEEVVALAGIAAGTTAISDREVGLAGIAHRSGSGNIIDLDLDVNPDSLPVALRCFG